MPDGLVSTHFSKMLFDSDYFKSETMYLIHSLFQHIRGALGGSDFRSAADDLGIGHLFLVGGFAESPILQGQIL
jgi:hypothetical protein